MPYFTNRGITPLPSAAGGLEWDTGKTTLNVALSGTPKLVATGTGTTASGNGTAGVAALFHTSGKYYWEVTCTTDIGGTNLGIGAISATFTMGSTYVGGDNLSLDYFKTGVFFKNTVNIGSTTTWTTGTVIGVALDLDNDLIWFRLDAGAWKGAGGVDGNPVTASVGIDIASLNVAGGVGPAVDFETSEAGSVLTANFGTATPVSTIPYGYVFLDGTAPPAQAWNSADKSSTVALSGGDLIATSQSGVADGDAVRGRTGRSNLKVYWEVVVTSNTVGGGVAIASSVFLLGGVAGLSSSACAYASDGNIYLSSSVVGSISTWTTGDVISVAVNLDTRRLWFRKNAGTWTGTAAGDPAAGTNGIDISGITGALFPLVDFRSGGAGSIMTARFITASYTQSVPSDYGNFV